MYEVECVFQYVKVHTFGKSIKYNIHCDKTKLSSDKINVKKMYYFFN